MYVEYHISWSYSYRLLLAARCECQEANTLANVRTARALNHSVLFEMRKFECSSAHLYSALEFPRLSQKEQTSQASLSYRDPISKKQKHKKELLRVSTAVMVVRGTKLLLPRDH